MGDKESRGPSSGGAYDKKWLSLREGQKRESHKITYRSGHHETELNLVLIRNNSYGESRNVKQSLENKSQLSISQWCSLFA